jgi:hypothetical protein
LDSIFITALNHYIFGEYEMRRLLIPCLLALSCFANTAFAKMVSDAPYYPAWHDTATWQMLGSNNNVDDGVWWSTDGGSSWGHDGLLVGDSVTFRFDMWTSGFGNHNYNQIKAWVDWNQDFYFDNNSETVIEDRAFFTPLDDSLSYLATPKVETFITDAFSITDAMIGDLWIRARVQCNEVPFGHMTPYGGLWQGEVEDWKLSVSDVPEPSSIMLMSLGVLGLFGARARKSQ